MQFAPKGEDLAPETEFLVQGDTVEAAELRLRVVTNGLLTEEPLQKETLFYSYGHLRRPAFYRRSGCGTFYWKEVPAGHTGLLELVFSLEESPLCCEKILYQAQAAQKSAGYPVRPEGPNWPASWRKAQTLLLPAGIPLAAAPFWPGIPFLLTGGGIP